MRQGKTSPADGNLMCKSAEKTHQKESGMVITLQVNRLDLDSSWVAEGRCFALGYCLQCAFHCSLLVRTLFDFPPLKISLLKSDIIDLGISADVMYTFVT